MDIQSIKEDSRCDRHFRSPPEAVLDDTCRDRRRKVVVHNTLGLMTRVAAFALLLFCSQSNGAGGIDVVGAATRFMPGVQWRADSVVELDLTCRGRVEYAILGTTKPEQVLVEGRPVGQRASEVVVAVFVACRTKEPRIFQSSTLDPGLARLVTEELNFDVGRLKAMLGEIPEGLSPSARCKGLNLTDGQRDSVHIYWNHKRGDLGAWSL